MRAVLASLAAVAAMAFATPSFAQADPAEPPAAQPKTSGTAHCNKLKSADSKAACLKRVQTAKVAPAPQPQTPKARKAPHKPTPAAAAPRPDSTAQAPATAMPPANSTVNVPPLPQKTI